MTGSLRSLLLPRLYREERDRLKKIAEEEERQRKRAEDRAKRAREKEERALRRAAEKLARAQAAEKAFEEWKAGEEVMAQAALLIFFDEDDPILMHFFEQRVTFEDGSTYVGEFRARRRDVILANVFSPDPEPCALILCYWHLTV